MLFSCHVYKTTENSRCHKLNMKSKVIVKIMKGISQS